MIEGGEAGSACGMSAALTWDSEAHFELAWQEEVAIHGLRGVLKVGAEAVESPVCCHLGVLQNKVPRVNTFLEAQVEAQVNMQWFKPQGCQILQLLKQQPGRLPACCAACQQ